MLTMPFPRSKQTPYLGPVALFEEADRCGCGLRVSAYNNSRTDILRTPIDGALNSAPCEPPPVSGVVKAPDGMER